MTSEGQLVLPSTLRDKYFSGQVRALLRYKCLEEQDFEEQCGLEGDSLALVMNGRITYDNLQGMIKRGVRGSVVPAAPGRKPT